MMKSIVYNIGFKMKKHAPELLIVTGVIGVVTGTVFACKATLKAPDVLEETNETVDIIHEAKENGVTAEGVEYTDTDATKDLTKVYIKTAGKLAKLYGPSIAISGVSIGCILASNNILRKRYIGVVAAYTAVDSAFKEYRERVVERFGEAVDKELRYNVKAKKVTEQVADPETGKVKKEKRTILVADSASEYARFFEKYVVDPDTGERVVNPCWNDENEYNVAFLTAQQAYANDLLRAKKRLFLNDVYRMLGLPESKAGQVVGWKYDKNNNNGDNRVTFGLFSGGSDNYSDFVYGEDCAILLDFNVDGVIWEDMKDDIYA